MEDKAADHKSDVQDADDTANIAVNTEADLNEATAHDNPQQSDEDHSAQHKTAADNHSMTGKATKKKVKKKGKRPGNGLLVLCLIMNLGIIATVLIGWKLIQGPLNQLQQSESDLMELREDIQLHQHGTKDFSDDVDQLTLQQGNQTKQVLQLKESLNRMQTRVAALTSTSKEDWLFAEAEYLLRLANQRITMGKDVVGAEALLLTADQILRKIDDTAFYAVRDAISQDITSIRLLEPADITGIYLQLSSIKKRVNDLKLEYDFDRLEESVKEQPLVLPDQSSSGFSRFWQSLKDHLSRYITVHHSDEQVKHLMLPEEQYYLTQNLRFMLEQAQLGLLSANQVVYDDSLANAISWLQTYFPTQEMALAITKNLQLLQKKKIVMVLPDISGSLAALQEYIKLSHSAQSLQQTQVREKLSVSTGEVRNINEGSDTVAGDNSSVGNNISIKKNN